MRAVRRSKGHMMRNLVALACAGVLVLAAACGEDNGEDAAPEPDPESTEEEVETPEPDATGGVPTDECLEVLTAWSAAFTGALAPGMDVDFDDALDSLEAIAGGAPEEIRDDFELIVGAFEEFQRQLAEAGVDFEDPASFADPEVAQQLQGLGEVFDDPAIQEASDNIEAYFDEVCPEFTQEFDDDFDDFQEFEELPVP